MGKITYVSLEGDETIHEQFEEGLAQANRLLGKTHPLYIGGREAYAGEVFSVTSPIDRHLTIGTFQRAGAGLAGAAIDAADAAFGKWSSRPWEERTVIIEEAADRLEHSLYLLAALITLESGKPRGEAIAEVGEAIELFRYNARIMWERNGFVTPMPANTPEQPHTSVMRPYGTWAVISPFNFPLMLAAGAASSALMTGNTVVLKPTSATPLTAIHLYHALAAGVPDGVINLITGPGEPFGDVIVGSPKVAGIAFTGSRAVGMRLKREFTASQPYPKPVVLEMGSKNPCIVTAHADIEKAAEGVARGAFGATGQKCSATSRVYVHESVFDAFAGALTRHVQDLPVGDPRLRETFMGPLIDEQAAGRFRASVDEVRRAGGTILCGGDFVRGGILDEGYYPQATVVTGIPDSHRLMKEELFVPFLILAPYATLAEALERANNTEYGLTAGIFTENPAEADEFFEQIRFGVCYANRRGGATTGGWPGAQSFGGWKASGATGKGVGGPYYLLSYMHEQARTRL
ncbi:1-pyrroline-5-carboxylate dehydrogenase [Methanomicrobiaceae archaeon CYW5]|nr:1-pyrroline-5-carboxylate dehydrogenase [Methanovulcanius yangii]